MMRIVPLATLITLAACGPEAYFEGAICPAPEVLAEFSDGDDLEVLIVFDECLPGCGGDTQTECTVTRDGDNIEIDARATYRKRGGATAGCAAVCRPLATTCAVTGLEPGTYTITSGTHSLAVTLPSDDPPAYDKECGY